MAAAEHVKRQVAVAIVIAVEEPPLLLAVQRIIRRIEVENDLPGRPRMRLQEQVDQQRPDRDRIVADLVVARRRKLAQLQPIERRLAGHRRELVPLSEQFFRVDKWSLCRVRLPSGGAAG